MYLRLDANEILATVQRLKARIAEHLPDRGLAAVIGEIEGLAVDAGRRADELGRPHRLLRTVAWLLSASILVVLAALVIQTGGKGGMEDFASFLTTLEAGLGSMVFIGAGILFVVTFEHRLTRKHVFDLVDELRSVAHVVDMHQLTKSPEKLLLPGPRTASSREEELPPFLLVRYLDYCSESLSLISKIAALYVRDVHDHQALEAADQIESLTGGLTRKIWQKIMILGDVGQRDRPVEDSA